ncbi:hypothetical protein HFP15_10935 [Amycolatopsis sp. K13G38]|uniref:Flagellar basal body-associated protein FliL n=1 Tax=Amycolatopsis acididurans TaxID=2724524 RepID=A0ABX1J4X2_9PSEU|nr:hypothetical protein [Amycolatopsis acididurans]
MSWQEELRKLDEELASGRLSADDYRVRRDQVLSSAVGQPDTQQSPSPQQNGGNSADSTQVIAPVSPPHGTPQQQPPADNSADRTQAVPPWQPQQQPADAGRTEYVAPPQAPYSPPQGFPQAGPASPAGGFPQAQQPWNAPESDQSPPWGGGDLPPLVPAGDSGWVQQGPESFEDKPKKGNGAKIGAIVAAVVVLAGIAFGAYMLWGRDSGGAAEQNTATPAPSSVQAPPDPMAVADVPGTAENYDSIKTFTQIPALNYLTSDELSTYETAQASDVKFVVHDLDGGARVILMLTEVNSPAAAQNAASQLLATQIRNGATRVSGTPAGVLASSVDAKDGAPAQIRAHYAHDNVVVRIEVTAPGSLQTARTNFDSILDAQLKALPSNG